MSPDKARTSRWDDAFPTKLLAACGSCQMRLPWAMQPFPLHVTGDWVIFTAEPLNGMSRVGSAPVSSLRRIRLVGLRPGHPRYPAPARMPAGRVGANSRRYPVELPHRLRPGVPSIPIGTRSTPMTAISPKAKPSLARIRSSRLSNTGPSLPSLSIRRQMAAALPRGVRRSPLSHDQAHADRRDTRGGNPCRRS